MAPGRLLAGHAPTRRAARTTPATRQPSTPGPHSRPGATPVRPQDRTRGPCCRTPRRGKNRPNPRDLAANNADASDPNAATTPTCRWSRKPSTCRPTSSNAPSAGRPSPPSPEPTTAPSWKSRCGPIAGSFADDAIGPPVAAAAMPALSPPRRRPSSCPRACWACRSGWRVLLDKYLFYRPTYRLLDDLATEGLPLSLGTITDGLQRLLPLLEPLYDALVERSRQQTLWTTPTRRVGWCTPAWKARSAAVGICGSSTAATWWCSCWPAAAPTTCRKSTWVPWPKASWWWIAMRPTRRCPR